VWMGVALRDANGCECRWISDSGPSRRSANRPRLDSAVVVPRTTTADIPASRRRCAPTPLRRRARSRRGGAAAVARASLMQPQLGAANLPLDIGAESPPRPLLDPRRDSRSSSGPARRPAARVETPIPPGSARPTVRLL
jgi:hypothetical protein